MTKFQQLGGEPAVRAILRDFVDRIFDDVMIGFFFARASRERIAEFEYQHAAAFLGADIVYEGRPLGAAHGSHAIRGGHFERRKEILRQVLVAHGVPDDIRAEWIAHTESLRAEITGDPGSECRDR
jgi:hemoglobin